jgi:hypothetical protein
VYKLKGVIVDVKTSPFQDQISYSKEALPFPWTTLGDLFPYRLREKEGLV